MLHINWRPSQRELRLFGGLWTPLFFVITAASLLYRHGPGSLSITIGLCVAAAVVGFVGWTAPAVLRPVYLVLIVLTFPLGSIVSHLILFALFYGVVTPV